MFVLSFIALHTESMELRQLTYFDAVVRHGGFTRAAEQLHVAQPAISAQIRRLEAELGVALLARTTRRVRLTQAGELFLTRTRRVLDELDAGRADLNQIAGVLLGRVRIGAVEALDPFDLPGALADFHTRYPGVELVLRSARGEHLLAGLDADNLDFALGPTPTGLPARFSAQPLFIEELVIITAPAHHLARRPTLSLADLSGEAFICLPPDGGLRTILNEAAASAGFIPRVPFESNSGSRIRDLVSHGLGVALLARSATAAPGRPVIVHSVHPDRIHRAIGLIYHRGHDLSPAAQACRQLLVRWHTPAGDTQQA